MSAPLVSVLIPCFNAAPYVGAAIESVLAQTYAPIEVIVVDDGSTDGSAAVVETFRGRGVTVITQANAGQCAAANRALAAARGELIKFFDADDLMATDMIERQVARIGSRRDAIAMSEWARFRDNADTARFDRLPMYRDADPIDWLTSEWLGGEPMMQCAIWLIPRNLLEKSGTWNERLSLINDFEFFSRVLLQATELLYSQGARLYYRSGVSGSLSAQTSRKAAESACLSLLTGTSHLLAARDNPQTRRASANILKTFDHGFYPAFPDLRSKINARVNQLGGSDLQPVGPPGFHALRRWIGWRPARRIQRLRDLLRKVSPLI